MTFRKLSGFYECIKIIKSVIINKKIYIDETSNKQFEQLNVNLRQNLNTFIVFIFFL